MTCVANGLIMTCEASDMWGKWPNYVFVEVCKSKEVGQQQWETVRGEADIGERDMSTGQAGEGREEENV